MRARRVWQAAAGVQTALALVGVLLAARFRWEKHADFDLLYIAWSLGNAPGCFAVVLAAGCGALAAYCWVRAAREG